MNTSKMMLKIAARVCDSLRVLTDERLGCTDSQIADVCRRMMHLTHDSRLFGLALRRHWTLAARKLQHRMHRQVSDLYYHLQTLKSTVDQKSVPVPPLSEVVADLMQVEEEYGPLQYDPADQSVSIVTEPITLEDVSLGSFQIRLFIDRISQMNREIPYRVIAADPNPAGTDSSVTHPHVSNEYLCEGDGHLLIRKALEQGRLCDFFSLVIGILNTYNPDSPYVRLEDWDGYSCYDCGRTTGREDSYTCESCNNDFCDLCSSYCRLCESTTCLGCLTECPQCHAPVCAGCTMPCNACQETLCRDCIDETGMCQPCQDQRKDECDEDEQTNTSAA